MSNYRIPLAGLAFTALAASSLWAQSSSKLTARELFYTPLPQTKAVAAAKKAPPAKQAPVQQAAARKAPNRPAPVPTKQAPRPQDVEPQTPQVQLAGRMDPEVTPGDAQFMNVANAGAIPLGLRYSILKYGGDDEAMEVDPDMVFRSGDKIRLRVQVNDTGYLYIVTQGSSGNWRVLFPSAEHDQGNNRVTRGRSYDIPNRTRFVFDEQPGTEKLFLVLTRTPEHDLDRLIYQLENPREPETGAEPKAQKPPTMLAMNTMVVSDDLVSQIRNRLTARDLVFEKVSDDKPVQNSQRDPERAVYVVNPARDTTARLVVDVLLKHR